MERKRILYVSVILCCALAIATGRASAHGSNSPASFVSAGITYASGAQLGLPADNDALISTSVQVLSASTHYVVAQCSPSTQVSFTYSLSVKLNDSILGTPKAEDPVTGTTDMMGNYYKYGLFDETGTGDEGSNTATANASITKGSETASSGHTHNFTIRLMP